MISYFRKLSKVLLSHKLYRQDFYSNNNLENKQFSLDGIFFVSHGRILN